MDLLLTFIDILLHLDVYLDTLIRNYGVWTYAILIIVIFCETGLVVTPFLPGDSLLFAVGTFAALGSLQIEIVTPALALAAIAGDSSNYWIGYFTGPKVFQREKSRLFNREYLDRTHRFYEKHGRKTIIFARFLPIIRTFAPFVAGIGRMHYFRFVTYSIAGNIAWMCTFIFGGYFFGNIPIVKENFTLVIMAIIIISVMPGLIGFLNQRFKNRRS
ncbi:MAG: DedA family protein [Syntrophaceae bacterium]